MQARTHGCAYCKAHVGIGDSLGDSSLLSPIGLEMELKHNMREGLGEYILLADKVIFTWLLIEPSFADLCLFYHGIFFFLIWFYNSDGPSK